MSCHLFTFGNHFFPAQRRTYFGTRRALVNAATYEQFRLLHKKSHGGDMAAGYSFLHFGNSGGNALGGSFSAAVNANRWFGIAGDFGAYSQSPTKIFTYLAGPRFSVRMPNRITPYVETLFGGAHLTTSGFPSTNAFTFLAGGGLDLGVSPSVALRPQVDYVAMRSGGSTLNAARISVGLALRIGRRRSR